MKITAEMLRQKNACEEQVKIFKVEWPNGAVINLENVMRALELGLDIGFVARHFFMAPALAEFEKARAPAWAEFDKARATAWAEFKKAKATAWAEFDKARATAWAEFDKARATAWAEFDKARATAWAEYEKTRATAWAEYEKTRALAFLAASKIKMADKLRTTAKRETYRAGPSLCGGDDN